MNVAFLLSKADYSSLRSFIKILAESLRNSKYSPNLGFVAIFFRARIFLYCRISVSSLLRATTQYVVPPSRLQALYEIASPSYS